MQQRTQHSQNLISQFFKKYSQLIFDKRAKAIQWSKDSLFNKWCWINWTPKCKRMNLDTNLTCPFANLLQKILNMDPRPTCKMTDRQAGLPGYSAVKNSPANAGDAGDMVQSLRREAPLKEKTATHSTLLAGEPHGQRSLVCYSLRGRSESDTTE